MDALEVLLAGAASLAGGVAYLLRASARQKNTPETLTVLQVAFLHTSERGHGVCTVSHVALALLNDPDVAVLLEQRGASLEALYVDLEALLPARSDRPVTLQPGAHTMHVVNLLRASAVGRFAVRPRHLLGQLLRSEHLDIRTVFERHGITMDRLQRRAPRRDRPAIDETIDGAYGPYRAPPVSNATTDVLVWNDSKTSMEFVVGTLRGVFGIVEPRATALMLAVHRDEVAVVGTYEREHAETLAATSMRLAKERGFPLKVTTEEASHRKSRGVLARWLHRRATRRDVPLAPSRASEGPATDSAWVPFEQPVACPSCMQASTRYRRLSDGALVCTGCGRSFEHTR